METNKGGRIAQKSSIFWSSPARRGPDTQDIKRQFGSVGVDCFICAQERIAQSDFFLFQLSDKNLRRIQDEDLISSQDFLKVVRFATVELGVFDPVLFENNVLFSIQFVRNFANAGLFRNRTHGVDSILKAANFYRQGHESLTLEDELELIALGKKSSHNRKPQPGTNVFTTPIKTNNKLNTDDQDLPF